MKNIKTEGEITKPLVGHYQSLDDLIACGLPFHMVESYSTLNYNDSEEVISAEVADLMYDKYDSEINHFRSGDSPEAKREAVVNALLFCCESLRNQFEEKITDSEMTIDEYERAQEKSSTRLPRQDERN